MNELVEKVRQELARYDHPLFGFDTWPAAEGVEVEIRLKRLDFQLGPCLFLLRPREVEQSQFPWTFQKQLYDCLHDYIIEMFISNPQRKA